MPAIETSLSYVRELFQRALMGWEVPVSVRWVDEDERVAVSFKMWGTLVEFEMQYGSLFHGGREGWSPDLEVWGIIDSTEKAWEWLAACFHGALNVEKEEHARDVAELNERLHERTQGFLRRAAGERQEVAALKGQMEQMRVWTAGALWGHLARDGGVAVSLAELIRGLERRGVDEGMIDGMIDMIECLPQVVWDEDLNYRDTNLHPLSEEEEASGRWLYNHLPVNGETVSTKGVA